MALRGKLKDRLKSARSTGKLILNFLKLSKVPPEFAACSSLTELHLAGNRFKDLPPWIADCREIREINLAGNPISKLPEFLGALPKLELLRIEDTRVRTLPSTFGTAKRLKELWLPEGMKEPGGTVLKAAIARAKKIKAEMEHYRANMWKGVTGSPEPEEKKPRPRPPWKRLGGVASLNASLSVLIGDAPAAAGWEGPRSPLAKPAVAARLRKSKIVEVGGLRVVDSAAGQGTADVVQVSGVIAVVEPDWDVLTEEAPDPAASSRVITAAIAQRGKELGRVAIPSGKLVLAWGWSDLASHAERLKKAMSVDLEDDGLVLSVKPGTYRIERREVGVGIRTLTPCIIVLRRV
jgi:hypothetical protein